VRGRISGAYRSDDANRLRVKKSSDGREGAVKLEKDLAAERKACREAVRLDLNLKRLFEADDVGGVASGAAVMSKGESSGIGKESNGCS
jgi:hypothetical protein